MDGYLFIVDGLRCMVDDKKTREGSEVHDFFRSRNIHERLLNREICDHGQQYNG